MLQKKQKYAEILSALVFMPPAESKITAVVRTVSKNIFNLTAKILSIFL